MNVSNRSTKCFPSISFLTILAVADCYILIGMPAAPRGYNSESVINKMERMHSLCYKSDSQMHGWPIWFRIELKPARETKKVRFKVLSDIHWSLGFHTWHTLLISTYSGLHKNDQFCCSLHTIEFSAAN